MDDSTLTELVDVALLLESDEPGPLLDVAGDFGAPTTRPPPSLERPVTSIPVPYSQQELLGAISEVSATRTWDEPGALARRSAVAPLPFANQDSVGLTHELLYAMVPTVGPYSKQIATMFASTVADSVGFMSLQELIRNLANTVLMVQLEARAAVRRLVAEWSDTENPIALGRLQAIREQLGNPSPVDPAQFQALLDWCDWVPDSALDWNPEYDPVSSVQALAQVLENTLNDMDFGVNTPDWVVESRTVWESAGQRPLDDPVVLYQFVRKYLEANFGYTDMTPEVALPEPPATAGPIRLHPDSTGLEDLLILGKLLGWLLWCDHQFLAAWGPPALRSKIAQRVLNEHFFRVRFVQVWKPRVAQEQQWDMVASVRGWIERHDPPRVSHATAVHDVSVRLLHPKTAADRELRDMASVFALVAEDFMYCVATLLAQ